MAKLDRAPKSTRESWHHLRQELKVGDLKSFGETKIFVCLVSLEIERIPIFFKFNLIINSFELLIYYHHISRSRSSGTQQATFCNFFIMPIPD